DSTNTATLTPSAALNFSTTYTATVSGVRDLAGDLMSAPVSWTFTTEASTTPPIVISETPASGATDVNISTTVVAAFSEPTQSNTINFTLKDSSGNSVPVVLSYNPTTATATWTPSSALANGTTYTATISGSQNSANVALSTPIVWSFRSQPLGLIGEWQFNEGSGTTTADSTGNGFNGTLVGNVSWTTGLVGPYALSFSGGHADVADNPILEFSSTQSWSLAMWVYVPSLPGAWQGVVEKSLGTGNQYGLWISSNNQWTSQNSYADLYGPTVSTGWSHVALVSDGSAQTMTMYVNGVSVASSFNWAADGTGDLYMGSDQSGENFYGALDDVRLYNIALSSSQVQTLYAAGTPGVTSVSPASGTTSVSTSSKVSVNFNEPVQAGTIGFTLTGSSGSPVAASVSYNSSADTATLTPSSALAAGTTYTATVSGVQNNAGVTMSAPVSWSFSTAASSAGPTVTSEMPAPNTTGVTVSSPVTATFNEAVQSSTVSLMLTSSAGTSVPGTLSYNTTTNTETFTPTAPLAYGTSYTATVSGAKDTAGDPMSGPVTWSFTTDAVQPAVASHTPLSGATGVAVSSPLTATFNEAVQSNTISFTLANSAGASVPATLSYNSSNFTVTLTPNSALAYGTTYTATVSGAKDTAGDPMAAAVSWSFTTDAAQPAVASHTPLSGATGVAVSSPLTATFNEAVQSSTISFTLANSAGTSVPASLSYNSSNFTVTLTP